jgi:hypothetical protein
MAITLFGSASTPADNGTQAGPGPITVTVPGSMQAGDLVTVLVDQRTAGQNETFSVPNTGGQTWHVIAWGSTTSKSWALFACRFNGSWSANPTFQNDSGGATPLTAKMDAWRASSSSKILDIARSPIVGTFAAGTTPFTKTITGFNTIIAGECVIAYWMSVDDNTWGSLTAGWTNAGGAQIRNASGSQTSVSAAYQVFASPGATGNVSQDQATNGGDTGATCILSIYERDPPGSIVLPVDMLWSAENSTDGTAMSAAIMNAGTQLAAATGTWLSPIGAGGPNLTVATAGQQGFGTRAFSVSGVNKTDASGTRGMAQAHDGQNNNPYNFAWEKTSSTAKVSSFCWVKPGMPYALFHSFTILGLQDTAFGSGVFLNFQNFESAQLRLYHENTASDTTLLARVPKDVWYGAAMLYDTANNIGRIALYDTSLNQIGFSTGLRLGTSAVNFSQALVGGFGGNYPTDVAYAGTKSYFDNLALDFTSQVFPLLPVQPVTGGVKRAASQIGSGGMADMSGGMQGRAHRSRSRIVVPPSFRVRGSRGARPELRA